MQVLIPTNPDFNYEQCKKLYEDNQSLLQDNQSFDELISNTFFYSFFVEGKHIGCIYYYEKDGKLFVNVVAYRKTPLINIRCFKESLTWWNCDIYAQITNKTSVIGALRCGFKKISDNLYKFER